MNVYKNVLMIIFIFNKILYVNRIVIINMLIQYLVIYVMILVCIIVIVIILNIVQNLVKNHNNIMLILRDNNVLVIVK